MERQQLGQDGAHLLAGHDLVHKAVFLQIFRPLEALGELLADGLFDDAGTGKADAQTRPTPAGAQRSGSGGEEEAQRNE